ncbi:Retrovirus-related Pol polyprotein from transposon TNT 1-94 [Dendrobium catenatum]|uniref:Retrovirus-related Pol polyprotein from transposon TNT 1-94 n=1 Tax=Dendrobium catenatum TaxID=906689 RepID=A0A2I0W6N8_9ASPA|nr:Retrovirus-related Pol polyprotein from transposon TNT 1-94 [Dendrobium catenatum]
MGDQISTNSVPPTSSYTNTQPEISAESITIPQPLKFLVSNIKNLAPHHLTADNYPIWRMQIFQQFAANGYSGHLTGTIPAPEEITSDAYIRWKIVDSNLLSALFSTISQSILPYIITSATTHDAWTVLERRLQPTSRSRVMQLKNELYRITMKDQSLQQYLNRIKSIVDNISASGSKVESEDVILHILNGLPPTFNSFKSTIHNSLSPINLDTFYSLLCNEDIHLQQEQQLDIAQAASQTALYAAQNGQFRSRPTKKFFKNKNVQYSSQPNQSAAPTLPNPSRPTCQICGKLGHIAINCWHRSNPKYAPTDTRQPRALLTNQTANPTQDWVLDSGASTHLTPDANNLFYPTAYTGSDSVSTANGTSLPIQNSGQGLLPLPDHARKLFLHNLLHVPALTHNLLSVSKLTKDNSISISFDANGFVIKDLQDRRPLLHGRLLNGLYQIQHHRAATHSALTATNSTSPLWHARLGHPNSTILSTLAKQFSDIQTVPHSFSCISCNLAKSHKLSFNKNDSISSQPFELIHTDVWGPAPQISNDGYRYYIIFIDNHTRYSWLYFMHTKNEALSKFKSLCSLIKTQYNKTPKALRSDGGGEFTSTSFKLFLQENGIQQQLSCPHTPEQNGLAERKHRHLLEITRALLHASNVPHKFWADALSTAHYLVNLLPSKAINLKIPFQRLQGKPPTYSHLRTFGCLCFPWLKPYTTNKFSPRSAECVFLGYSPNHKGYRCYDIKNDRLYTSRHVVFHENSFPYTITNQPTPQPEQHLTPAHSPLLLPPATNSSISIQTTTPSRLHNPQQHMTNLPSNTYQSPTASPICSSPTRLSTQQSPPRHQMQTRLKSGISKPKQIFNLLAHSSQPETPSTYNQASKSAHWTRAMTEEFQALKAQNTWSLVPKPSNKSVLGSKWTFKTKLLPNGQVDRYKARLVALGYNQQFGINYTETFSPVAKMPTIRLLLTLAVNRQWPMHQLDVSNAFLHGDLPDDIYMRQPPGFTDPNQPDAVCKLQKSLYGLKQAPRQWFTKLTTFLQTQGFRFSRSDPSLLIFHKNNIQIYFLIYVDDFLITGNNASAIKQLLQQLQAQFALKQLGQISLFLGIQVLQSTNGYFLSQQHYATKILHDAGYGTCNPATTPATPSSKPVPSASPPFHDPTLYRKLAGSLQYLSITRPDIAFATNAVCQHMQYPTDQDFKALKRLLRYIKGTITYGLPINTGPLELRTYTDADWASDSSDRKSISGYCSFLGPTIISWTVKKQATVAKSSTEAEYRALSAATSEVLWLRRLAEELNIPQPAPTPIYCDNTSAIAIAKNPVFHARTKHIEIDYHFIRHHIDSNAIQLIHIGSNDQIADILTKPFPITRFNDLRNKLNIQPMNA